MWHHRGMTPKARPRLLAGVAVVLALAGCQGGPGGGALDGMTYYGTVREQDPRYADKTDAQIDELSRATCTALRGSGQPVPETPAARTIVGQYCADMLYRVP